MEQTRQTVKKVVILGLEDTKKEFNYSDIAQGLAGDDLKNMHEFAILCNNVYCIEPFDTITEEEKRPLLLADWADLGIEVAIPPPPKGKIKVPGLKYKVMKKETGASNPVVALVFKGTETNWDWYTNFRWITRFIPYTWDHYEQTKAILPEIIQEIHTKVPIGKVEIIATGHSLGAGLAQLAAYASPHIKKVFAFNSSPVTGFYSIDKAAIAQNRIGIKVYRIFEHGEALEYFRSFMKLLYPLKLSRENPHIIEVKYDFVRKGAAAEHKIWGFAKNLQAALKASTESNTV